MIVLIDTQILLRGANLGNLPFHELGFEKPTIVIHGKVLKEIDGKKYDSSNVGKKAKRAISCVTSAHMGQLSPFH